MTEMTSATSAEDTAQVHTRPIRHLMVTVGTSPDPLLIGIRALAPEHVIWVHTVLSRDVMALVQRNLGLPALHKTEVKVDVDDPSAIAAELRTATEGLEGPMDVLCSGGSSAMAVAAGLVAANVQRRASAAGAGGPVAQAWFLNRAGELVGIGLDDVSHERRAAAALTEWDRELSRSLRLPREERFEAEQSWTISKGTVAGDSPWWSQSANDPALTKVAHLLGDLVQNNALDETRCETEKSFLEGDPIWFPSDRFNDRKAWGNLKLDDRRRKLRGIVLELSMLAAVGNRILELTAELQCDATLSFSEKWIQETTRAGQVATFDNAEVDIIVRSGPRTSVISVGSGGEGDLVEKFMECRTRAEQFGGSEGRGLLLGHVSGAGTDRAYDSAIRRVGKKGSSSRAARSDIDRYHIMGVGGTSGVFDWSSKGPYRNRPDNELASRTENDLSKPSPEHDALKKWLRSGLISG